VTEQAKAAGAVERDGRITLIAGPCSVESREQMHEVAAACAELGVRVMRGGEVVFTGKLASLKRFQDDVRDVAQNFECGISIEGFNDLVEGDIIEAYVVEEKARVV